MWLFSSVLFKLTVMSLKNKFKKKLNCYLQYNVCYAMLSHFSRV